MLIYALAAPVLTLIFAAMIWGMRESAFQTVVARVSRPCVGCTIRTGGTPAGRPCHYLAV